MADFTELQEKMEGIREQIAKKLSDIRDSRGVYEYRKDVMDGKTGIVGALMRETGKLPKEERAEYGKMVNRLKDWVSERFDEADRALKEAELNLLYESEKIDVTLPSEKQPTGWLHPVTKVTNEIIDIFSSMGFSTKKSSLKSQKSSVMLSFLHTSSIILRTFCHFEGAFCNTLTLLSGLMPDGQPP